MHEVLSLGSITNLWVSQIYIILCNHSASAGRVCQSPIWATRKPNIAAVLGKRNWIFRGYLCFSNYWESRVHRQLHGAYILHWLSTRVNLSWRKSSLACPMASIRWWRAQYSQWVRAVTYRWSLRLMMNIVIFCSFSPFPCFKFCCVNALVNLRRSWCFESLLPPTGCWAI